MDSNNKNKNYGISQYKLYSPAESTRKLGMDEFYEILQTKLEEEREKQPSNDYGRLECPNWYEQEKCVDNAKGC